VKDNFRAMSMTAIAVAVLSVVMLSYVHNFIYTRIEGEKLEGHVQNEFEKIHSKLDTIHNLFMQKILDK